MPEAAHTAGGSGGVVPPGQHAVEDLGDFRARARQWIAANLESLDGADSFMGHAEALIRALKGRLSSFKVPRRVVLLRREEVPMIKMSSKVHRHALRDLVADRLPER